MGVSTEVVRMKYCLRCGSQDVHYEVPPMDGMKRSQCMNCGYIDYVNPRPVVGCIPVYGDKVLLCKRAIEPRRGQWTLPAGYMEVGETAVAAALRETWEEARARVRIKSLFVLFSLPHAEQVYLMYRAQLLDEKFRPGEESTDTRLFEFSKLPWDDIAFSTIRYTLELYCKDLEGGSFQIHTGTVLRTKTGDVMQLDEEAETPASLTMAAGAS